MEILVVTAVTQPVLVPAARVLPALDLLAHTRRVAGFDVRECASGAEPDVVLVDARRQLAEARGFCRTLRASGLRTPVLAVVEESGLVAVAADWGIDDVILAGAGPTEVEARLRLATQAAKAAVRAANSQITAGALSIDPDTYAAKLKGRALNLTYKEFELLRFLAQHPGRVYTRDQLLREVWGYDYFGGHRTVDVHVRRLRAKLGSEYESMIGTVRQVGYTMVLPTRTETELEPVVLQAEAVLQRA
ncbi:response regulator transcription factor [Dactylosporangium sp. NPDC005555]|uniref:response regulator transcription factor n=1 Tax=Dactylosporangium sp. NPDC005555 TaxID=3154889 RepID=UPI0033B68440